MSAAKKIGPVFDDQINAKIQRQFDLIFTEKNSGKGNFSNENDSSEFSDTLNFGIEEMVMESNGGKNNSNKSNPTIGLDLTSDDDAPMIQEKNPGLDLSNSNDDDGLGFSLDFEMESPADAPVSKTSVTQPSAITEMESGGFTLDDDDIGDVDFNADATQKTIVVNREMLSKPTAQDFKLDKTSTNASIDMMSSDEAKANIETTIKDIIRPTLDSTSSDIHISHGGTGISDIEDSALEFSNTPSKGLAIAEIDDGTFSLDLGTAKRTSIAELETEIGNDDSFELDGPTTNSKPMATFESTGEFDINALDSVEEDAATRIAEFSIPMPSPKAVVEPVAPPAVKKMEPAPAPVIEREYSAPSMSSNTSMGMGGSTLNAEDSMRFQATIRALREEREEMLQQIKNLKGDSKELEQDNLTLKANLDEAKIEITILRKRHMVEIEDLKYRLAMSDEKKLMADEKARQADMRREKLEQKVRIDFNQVKQREKELESKLELLSMDVDSQVQSREQKILELRRKIDALEFNMENASIKEQKSLDDKRKLEDRLNKIMKTLRHSIKNLEDDIDQVEDDGDHQKDKN